MMRTMLMAAGLAALILAPSVAGAGQPFNAESRTLVAENSAVILFTVSVNGNPVELRQMKSIEECNQAVADYTRTARPNAKAECATLDLNQFRDAAQSRLT